MAGYYEQFQRMLNDESLPHHEHQMVKAAIGELKDMMENKHRDVKRRLRERHDY